MRELLAANKQIMIKNLFIFGNGFDRAHELPTEYSDFQDYLIKIYPQTSEECLIVPNSYIMPDGEERYNDEEVVRFLLLLITQSEAKGERWCDLEDTLGHLDFDACFDDWGIGDDDENEWHTVYRNEDIAANIYGACQMIKQYFSNWIKTISLCHTKPKKEFIDLFQPQDYFWTFNYTKTLECLYGIKDVFHIHGIQGDNNLIFGHGNTADYTDAYMNNHIGAESGLCALQKSLKKDTKSIIDQNKETFKEFGNADVIYSYGFSFSDVDMPYIEELCSLSETQSIVWHMYCYNENDFPIFKRKLVKCGFQGKIVQWELPQQELPL